VTKVVVEDGEGEVVVVEDGEAEVVVHFLSLSTIRPRNLTMALLVVDRGKTGVQC
jgi:hypothetical protein